MFWGPRASTPVTQRARVGVSCSALPSAIWGGALLWHQRLLGTSWRRVWRGSQSGDVQCEGYWRCPGSRNFSPRRRPLPQMCPPRFPTPRFRYLSLRLGAVGRRPCARSSETPGCRPRRASTLASGSVRVREIAEFSSIDRRASAHLRHWSKGLSIASNVFAARPVA